MFKHVLRASGVALALGLTAAGAMAQPAGGEPPPSASVQSGETEWVVRAAPGMDAILMIGAAGGDVLQADIYGETIAFLRANMDAEAVAAMDRLDQVLRVERGQLTGPSLAYFFSVGSLDSIDAVLASARDPDRFIRPGLSQLVSWEEGRYERALELMPDVITALEGLKAIGFEQWYAGEIMPRIEAAIPVNLEAVADYDVIPEQRRLLGTPLEPRIEILIVRFSSPYGIRIAGQRFVAYHSWPGHVQLRVAAHEIFHPPYDVDDPDLLALTADLRADAWIRSVVENHNPAFGYNSFEGLLNEGSTQALDQIVSERLGFARDPGQRWMSHDGGMHVLAAAIYHAMVEDGFAQEGGVYADWLKSALRRGMLTPDEVRRRAAAVSGEEIVQIWYDAMEADAPAEAPSAH